MSNYDSDEYSLPHESFHAKEKGVTNSNIGDRGENFSSNEYGIQNCNYDNGPYHDQKPFSDAQRKLSLSLQENTELCLVCDNKIYPMEKLNCDGKLYHKNCFRCFKCRTILSITNFTLNNNSIYCKTHFMELFKLRGKFDDDEDIRHEIITGDDTETIPTVDTKSLLEKFRKLESESYSAPQPNYQERRNSNSNQRHVYATDDIVRSDDLLEEELPPAEIAKSMVAKFKAMEISDNVPSPISSEKMQLKAKANLTPNANVRFQSSNSQPYVNEDEYNKEEMPEEGTTRNLMSKFQGLGE